MKKFYIGKSKIKGKGIILNRDIKKDETIFIFLGREKIHTAGDWFHGPNWFQIGYAKWIEPRPGSAGNYLNHSCSPTAGVHGKNKIVAMRDLKMGEEITIDYALTETYPLWHMKCNCRSKNCRKIVKPYQDMPAQRMKKYVEYTSQYILDMKMHLSWDEYIMAKKAKEKNAGKH